MEKFVEFADVSKSYDGRSLVVKNLDLSITKGEFLTMLGPSGSGKTTMLMMLAGFETPSGGQIRLNGRAIQSVPPHKRNIGVVFQNYALFPHMSVGQNLAYPLQVRRTPRLEIERRINAALDMVQMLPFRDRRPTQLSGGQQQRIALARALVFEPDIVLMDEPLGALDKNLREHLQLEIKRLHDQLGVTVVYVTHDQSEALTMSDRIAVFNGGRIEQLATPTDLYERPQTNFVANFIGQNNQLKAVGAKAIGDEIRLDLTPAIHILAAKPSTWIEGQGVVLSLRPEKVRVGSHAEGLQNQLDATVREVIYLGDHIRIHAEIAPETVIVAVIASTALEHQPAAGEPIRVGWNASDSVIFSAD